MHKNFDDAGVPEKQLINFIWPYIDKKHTHKKDDPDGDGKRLRYWKSILANSSVTKNPKKQ